MRKRTRGVKVASPTPYATSAAPIASRSSGWILIKKWFGADSGSVARHWLMSCVRTEVSSSSTIKPMPNATTWTLLSRPRRATFAIP